MGCDPDPSDEHYEELDRIAEAHRIRKRVLAKNPVPSMLTLQQLEVWLEVFNSDGSIRSSPYGGSRPTAEQEEVLCAIEKRFYP